MEICPHTLTIFDGTENQAYVTLHQVKPNLWFVLMEDNNDGHVEWKFFNDLEEARKCFRDWADR
jgi:hypothetical protein